MIKFGMDPTPGQAAAEVAKAYFAAVEGSTKGRSSTLAWCTPSLRFAKQRSSYSRDVINGL